MRKFVWFITILLMFLLGGIFAAPNFIDWAQYRKQPKPSFKLWRSLLLDHLAVLKWLAVPSVLKNDISIMQ